VNGDRPTSCPIQFGAGGLRTGNFGQEQRRRVRT
jgi:hypothetical protein